MRLFCHKSGKPELTQWLGRVGKTFPGQISVVCLPRKPFLVVFNAMRIELVGEDQVKQKYLVMTITTSRSSRKLTYATWMRLFDEGDESCFDFVVEALLPY